MAPAGAPLRPATSHIGRGGLGLGAFRRLLRDRLFAGLPLCMETPKGADLAEDQRKSIARLSRAALGLFGPEGTRPVWRSMTAC